MLPYALEFKAIAELYASRFAAARATASEGVALARELRQENSIGRHLGTLAWIDAVQGAEPECRARCAEALSTSEARGLGLQAAFTHWALGLLELTLGRPQEAYDRLSRLLGTAVGASHPGIALLAVPDVVETALRTERLDAVRPLVARFDQFAGPDGPPWARALAARCRALTTDAADAEEHYLRALEQHARANRPWDTARTSLLYGEHLRRQRRRVDARGPLRAAAREFERLGTAPWLARAQGELRATGEHLGARNSGSLRQLTSQEFQIVGLVSEGTSNRRVAEQLFLSPRTVEYHLSKVYAKLGISSRAALASLDLDAAGAMPGP
jgi:ATP/maltotriose-dependent transcriptional regulator MalT